MMCSIIVMIFIWFVIPLEFADGKKFEYVRQDLEIVKHKGTVKTIESTENGEVIDCVDIYKQPAFDHPLLKNHTIQIMGPSENNEDKKMLIQEWNKNGEFCPKGSIPILRLPKLDYPKKIPLSINHSTTTQGIFDGHEYAIFRYLEKNYGGSATINVWNPLVMDSELSLAQIWVGSGDPGQLSTLEAGWIVDKFRHGNETRLFVFWTSENYQNGCYNLMCPGFVQVSSKITVGAEIRFISTYNGPQYETQISITKEQESGDWWLSVEGEKLGYWPKILFAATGLAEVADYVDWGGEIVNQGLNGQHTTTQMGSGHFPSEGFSKASYFKQLKFLDADGITFKEPKEMVVYTTKPSCYDIIADRGHDSGLFFFFGGPGYSDTCQI